MARRERFALSCLQTLREHATANNRILRSLTVPRMKFSIKTGSVAASHSASVMAHASHATAYIPHADGSGPDRFARSSASNRVCSSTSAAVITPRPASVSRTSS